MPVESEFRVLGPAEIVAGERRIDAGAPRQCCVLIALLADVNQAVPASTLISRVWGENPPPAERSTLHGYIYRLRGVLAAAGASITRQSSGYLLSADPDAIDMHRFHRLVAQARAAGSGPEVAIGRYEQALGLWRGEAFGTLDTPWINSLREALAAERLAAELDHTDLLLQAGQHTRLLPVLAARTAAHPLDERVCGQYMIALYRGGQAAGALECYQRTRRRLAEELGTDPGLPLQRLHQQILTGDPVLAAPQAATEVRAAAGPPVPRQLPPRTPHFVNRAAELARLNQRLEASSGERGTVSVATIDGTAGIGKTTLAVSWAHSVAERFPDGQLYVNLRGFDPTGEPMHPSEAVCGFLDALGIAPERIPATLDAQAGLYRSLLAGRRVLIVLDNARDAQQVRPLLPSAPACFVVITSRNELAGLVAGEGASPLTLGMFTPGQAVALLERHLGRERVMAEPGVVWELAEGCAGLPLALAIVAARAAMAPQACLRELADELASIQPPLEALDAGDPAASISSVLSWSYRHLDPAAARMFRLLGLHLGPDISLPAAASLAGEPIGQARRALRELTRAHMAIAHPSGRYDLHDLLRAYAAQQAAALDSDQDRRQAIGRVLDHYLHTADNAAQLIRAGRDPIPLPPLEPGTGPERFTSPEQAWTWCQAEKPVLLAAVTMAAEAGLDEYAWKIPRVLRTFLERQATWHENATVQRTALAAAQRLGDPAALATAHLGLAWACAQLSDYTRGADHHQRAIGLLEQAGDQAGQAFAHRRLGWMLSLQHRYSEALGHATRSRDLCQASGDQVGHAQAVNDIGWYHAHLGDLRQAVTLGRQALEQQRELGDRYGEADTLDSLGYAHHHLGRHALAIEHYQQAIDLYRVNRDPCSEAETLTRLAAAQHDAGNLQAARNAWQRALVIFEDLHHPGAADIEAKLARWPGTRLPDGRRFARSNQAGARLSLTKDLTPVGDGQRPGPGFL